jgi:dTDP-4-dehydrorhamnose reductase
VYRYGVAKAAAETAVRAVDPGAAVVRTSLIVGAGRGHHELPGSDYAEVLNVAGPDAISRYDLGVLMARRDGRDPAQIPAGSIAETGLAHRQTRSFAQTRRYAC